MMVRITLSAITPLRARLARVYLAGPARVGSKPIASIPMLLLSWIRLCVIRQWFTLPLTTTDSLAPRLRWSTSLRLMVRSVMGCRARSPYTAMPCALMSKLPSVPL
jgi:hypothetical protein